MDFTRGLIITPMNSTTTCASTSAGIRRTTEFTREKSYLTVVCCPNCSERSHNFNFCDHCQIQIPATAQKFHVAKLRQEDVPTMVVEQQICTTTNTVEKKIVYQFPSDVPQNQSFTFHPGKPGTSVSMNTKGKRRQKGRRKAELICCTLSSKATSSTSEMLHDENQTEVMDINPNLDGEEEIDEKEEHLVDEDDDEDMVEGQLPTDYPLRCRSIRIGSYKVHPPVNNPYVTIILQIDSLTFKAPVLTEPTKHVVISLRKDDINGILFHFGRCLPIMFVYTTPKFGESVRNALDMVQDETPYFDPLSRDEKTDKLTFLIENMTEDQKNFIRQVFPGEQKVKEINQKTANEILVRSTPATRVKLRSNHLPVTEVTLPPQLVILLTYPLPPQTGGIDITNEDLACLNEGVLLNYSIIDFYLKYVFCEKLSHSNQEKTYIFSSFFYSRLAYTPEEQDFADDPSKNYNKVKRWTRHVDIFSKDYIIIPVNKDLKHWILVIICYPNQVPDALNVPENKAADNVTMIDEQIRSNSERDNRPNPEDSTLDSSTPSDGKQRKEMPCICIFDSSSGTNLGEITADLWEYLEMEWKSKKGTRKVFDKNTIPGFIMKCPQATNVCDAGLHLLQCAENFFVNPFPFATPMPDLTNWFTEDQINKKRQELKDLIRSLQEKQNTAP